jgi:hypothetical protein
MKEMRSVMLCLSLVVMLPSIGAMACVLSENYDDNVAAIVIYFLLCVQLIGIGCIGFFVPNLRRRPFTLCLCATGFFGSVLSLVMSATRYQQQKWAVQSAIVLAQVIILSISCTFAMASCSLDRASVRPITPSPINPNADASVLETDHQNIANRTHPASRTATPYTTPNHATFPSETTNSSSCSTTTNFTPTPHNGTVIHGTVIPTTTQISANSFPFSSTILQQPPNTNNNDHPTSFEVIENV